MSLSSGSSVPRIQVFRPTMDEFKDFSKYIQKIESEGAHKAGLAKIIPPEGWHPRKKGYDNIELVIPAPISQVVTGRQGLYQQINIQQKAMSVKEFQKLAESNKYKTPPHFDYEDLERKYWKNITYNSPIYGADVSGSLYDDGIEEFNIQHLNTILDMVKQDYEISIEGVNTAYLYFGMWKTTFAWHTEDMDLYSINYLHFGAPKSWYVVPPEHGRRLERLATGFFHASHQSCAAFLRHKMTIISPQILKQYSIPYNKITQEPGEFMITFPFGYHSGFNHGFNCAESTNFALPRWVEYGKRTTSCTCRNDCVKICMDMFVRKFQPDKYELWKTGKDIGSHPEDPTRHYAAPAPRKLELALSAQREERRRAKELQQKIKRHPISKVNKADKKRVICAAEEDYDGETEEETELYEACEAVPRKNSKKQCKKVPGVIKREPKAIDVSVKAEKLSDTMGVSIKEEKLSDNMGVSIKVQKDVVTMDVSVKEEKDTDAMYVLVKEEKPADIMDISVKEEKHADAMEVSVKEEKQAEAFDVSFKEKHAGKAWKMLLEDNTSEADTKEGVEEKGYKVNSELENEKGKEQMLVKVEQEAELQSKEIEPQQTPVKEEITEKKSESCSPPELTPFWEQQAGKMIGIIKKPPAEENGPIPYQKQMELIHGYPRLRDAINSGAFSVVPVNSENTSTPMTVSFQAVHSTAAEDSPEENIFSDKQTDASPSPESNFVSTWRCEQVTNSLKIKFVQPKRLCQNSPSVTSNTSSEDVVSSSTSPQVSLSAIISKSKPKRHSRKNSDKKGNQDHRYSRSPPSQSQTSFKVRRADCSTDNWAYPIKDIWQHLPYDFEAETIFNERLASVPPHCAICSILTPMYSNSSFPTEPSSMPSYSQVKMPAFYYGNSPNSECMLDTNTLSRRDGTAPLLVCSVCKVSVHATCYGLSMFPSGPWMCTRCTNQAEDAACCLCVLRGGALKPTSDGRWAHIVCTILIPDTFFENTDHKQPINVSKITSTRQRLKCKYCLKTSVPKDSKGICVQCLCGKCYLPFHATCGYMAGVIFETNDWPEPIHMICTKHSGARRKPPKRELTNVTVGERIIAKHKNKRFYWANVKRKYIKEYYSILFEDNSHSTNTLPEDIVDRHLGLGSPKMNEKVKVKWTDEKVYNGVFKGSQSSELYVIEFDDGSVLHQERKQIYAADEELPKEVASKVSHSSDGRVYEFSEPEGKRARVSNSKYS